MPENGLFKNLQHVFSLIEELRAMSVEDLKDICMQYGEDNSTDIKDELIRTILNVELTPQEVEDYEKYLRYYYFIMFRDQMSGLSQIDGYITEIEDLYRVKNEAGSERLRASDRKRTVEFKLMDVLPLVRLNIEYSHVESRYDAFIKMMTKTGMELASITEAQEDIRKRGLIYSFLKKGKLEELGRKEDSYRAKRNQDLDSSYAEYVDVVKAYGSYLKAAFFKMLDNREIAEAVYLHTNLSNDFSSEEAYKLGYASNCKFTDEEKEKIFDEFIKDANFDPEQNLTGEMFYEAAKRFVTRYYDVMDARLSMRQSRCIQEIRELVGKERTIVDGMKQTREELGIFTPEEEATMSLIYKENGRRKK